MACSIPGGMTPPCQSALPPGWAVPSLLKKPKASVFMMPNDRHGIAVTPRATALCSSARDPLLDPPYPPGATQTRGSMTPSRHHPYRSSIASRCLGGPPLLGISRHGNLSRPHRGAAESAGKKRHKTSPPPPLTAWQVLVFVFWSLVVLLENPTPFSVVLVLQESCCFVSPSIHQAHHGFRLPTDHVTGVDHDASR